MNLIDYSSNADATAGKVVYVDRFMRNMTMSHLICCLLSPNVLGSSAKFDIARAAMPLLLKLGRGKGVSVEECAQKLEAELAMYLQGDWVASLPTHSCLSDLWGSMTMGKTFPIMQRVAYKLGNSVASECSNERMFSDLAAVHTSGRCNLDPAMVAAEAIIRANSKKQPRSEPSKSKISDQETYDIKTDVLPTERISRIWTMWDTQRRFAKFVHKGEVWKNKGSGVWEKFYGRKQEFGADGVQQIILFDHKTQCVRRRKKKRDEEEGDESPAEVSQDEEEVVVPPGARGIITVANFHLSTSWSIVKP